MLEGMLRIWSEGFKKWYFYLLEDELKSLYHNSKKTQQGVVDYGCAYIGHNMWFLLLVVKWEKKKWKKWNFVIRINKHRRRSNGGKMWIDRIRDIVLTILTGKNWSKHDRECRNIMPKVHIPHLIMTILVMIMMIIVIVSCCPFAGKVRSRSNFTSSSRTKRRPNWRKFKLNEAFSPEFITMDLQIWPR